MPALGPELGERCAQLHREHGVDLRLGAPVDLDALDADVIVVALGAIPNIEWLEGSGLSLDRGIVCDEYLQAAPHVYAAGDVVSWPHPLADGAIVRIEHWTNAAEQGTAAGRNCLGRGAQALRGRPVLLERPVRREDPGRRARRPGRALRRARARRLRGHAGRPHRRRRHLQPAAPARALPPPAATRDAKPGRRRHDPDPPARRQRPARRCSSSGSRRAGIAYEISRSDDGAGPDPREYEAVITLGSSTAPTTTCRRCAPSWNCCTPRSTPTSRSWACASAARRSPRCSAARSSRRRSPSSAGARSTVRRPVDPGRSVARVALPALHDAARRDRARAHRGRRPSLPPGAPSRRPVPPRIDRRDRRAAGRPSDAERALIDAPRRRPSRQRGRPRSGSSTPSEERPDDRGERR